MSNSKKVFVAADVIFAFIDRAHPRHDEADAYFRFFAQEEYTIFTDNEAIIYAYMTVYENISPSLAKDFLRTVALSNFNILYPEESDTKAALKALINFQSTDLTYPKALMSVLADKRNIQNICTFDYLHPLFGLQLFYLPI
jgi:predicted nucleic acid-binding protein